MVAVDLDDTELQSSVMNETIQNRLAVPTEILPVEVTFGTEASDMNASEEADNVADTSIRVYDTPKKRTSSPSNDTHDRRSRSSKRSSFVESPANPTVTR